MHQQQPPEHAELRQGVVTRLHSTHPLLSKQPNTNVSSLDHGHIVGSISNRQCYFVQSRPYNPYNLCLLDGQ